MRFCRRPAPARRASRRILSAALALACLWAAVGADPLEAKDEDGYRGRRLVDVLRQFQAGGLDVIFSSAVVGEDLRVSVEPEAADPRAVLDQILPPLGLRADDGPGGAVLIVPALPLGNLRGRVVSVARGTPVAGASVRLSASGEGAITDAGGSFRLERVPAGSYEVVVEAPGFVPATYTRVRVGPDRDAELRFELAAHPTFVTEVVVTPSRHSVVREEQASRHVVTHEEAVLVPTIGGDISRVVELLPGVAAADNSAAFNVRGSVAQDVALILDGLELYDPFHLQSFQSPFSVIDSNVVDRIDFFGGGFTADFGDRHGGFVDISTFVVADPGRGEVEVGTLNSRMSYRAPFAGGSGSWLFSVRGWYPDSLVDTTELGGGENLDPRFGDVYAKAAFGLGSRHRLSTHGLFAYDRLTFTETGEEVNESVDALTRNAYVWARMFSAWTPSLTSETVLSGGRIDRRRDGLSSAESAVIVEDDRSVDFLGLRHGSTWQLTDSHVLKAGAELRWLDADYRYVADVADDPDASVSLRLNPDGTSLALYVAHRVRIGPRLTTELGARWDRQDYTNDNQLSPRFNAVWRPGERSELRLAVGRFNQSQRIHELRVEDGETTFGRSEVAEQAELSYQYALRSGPRFRVDAYSRELSRLRPRYENLFEPIELFPETTEDRVRIAPREARLRGVELLVRGDPRRALFWWVSYARSSAEDVVDGRDVPRSWDQPHAGKFLIGYRLEERWSVSLSGSVHTGWPTTPVLAEVEKLPDGSIEVEPVPGERNTDRLSGYARFDLKARRAFSLPRGRLWLTLEVANLTDRRNPCCLDDVFFDERPDGSFDVRRQFDHWLGISPSFSVLWEF